MSRGREPIRRSRASGGGKRKKRRQKKSAAPKIIAMVVGVTVVIGVCAGLFVVAKKGWQAGMDAEARRRGLDPEILNSSVEPSTANEAWDFDPAGSDKLSPEIALGPCHYRHPPGFLMRESEPSEKMILASGISEKDDAGKRDTFAITVNTAPKYPTTDAGMEKLAKVRASADASFLDLTSGPTYERGTLNGKRCVRAIFEGFDRTKKKDAFNIHYSIVHNGVTAMIQINLTAPVSPERLQLMENAARSLRFE